MITANKFKTLGGLFDLEMLEDDIANNQAKMSEPDFWENSDAAQTFIQQANEVKETYDEFNRINDLYEEMETTYELIELEADEELKQELESGLKKLGKIIDKFSLEMLLNEEFDRNDAILEIQSGAGGTEAQDWVDMLYRMYTRWAEGRNFSIEVLDYQAGDEAGIKNVSMLIKGANAYGYLKAEKGIHRLVRISPFDSQKRRHTSFASAEVTPKIDEDIDIEINDDDLRIDTYRASGAGGQHVNKTSSAVRITHEPTGIVVASQAQRSQIQNRETAMQTLKAKLYQLEEEKKAAEMSEIKGEQKEIAWGSQIRSYVFHPYSMIKDHRTNVETGNVDKVMDGEIDPFIQAFLKWRLNSDNVNNA